MGRLLLALCLLAGPAWADSLPLLGVGSGAPAAGTWQQGIDFRANQDAGTVTDCAKCAFELGGGGGGAYPQTPSAGDSTGIGWSAGTIGVVNTRDRNTALDARLVGLHFGGSPGVAIDYEISLGSQKNCTIALADGDDGGATAQMVVQDGLGGTTLATVPGSPLTVAAGSVMAADGLAYTLANWVSSGAAQTVSVTFTASVAAFHFPMPGIDSQGPRHIFMTCT